jgi:hypothetical protein
MKRTKTRRSILLLGTMATVLTALLLGGAASASGSPTTGSWYSYPPQTHTDTQTTTSGSTAYQTAVRPPINADGSSNWPAKRGVIPVQFDLLAAPSTVTSTTRTYGPPVWKSIGSNSDTVDDYSFAGLNLSPNLPFSQITKLSANYSFTQGDCHGGSLRWTLTVMHDGVEKTMHVYYGTPNGPDQSCTGASSGSGQNLIATGITPNRFEMEGGWGVPGPVYTTYADALASTTNGTDVVTRAQLTLDSGWGGDQQADVSNVTVNDNTWVPKTSEVLNPVTTTGAYAKTCNLPAAMMDWNQSDTAPDGAINEAESIQPKDTGVYYRHVDCKYIYNLDVSSLNGKGTYRVWALIDGVHHLQAPAKFDLK